MNGCRAVGLQLCKSLLLLVVRDTVRACTWRPLHRHILLHTRIKYCEPILPTPVVERLGIQNRKGPF